MWENVLFPRRVRVGDDLLNRARELLYSVGLGNELSLYPAQLSAGMKKRLEFARALLNDDEYILADEPFGTLDVVTRRRLWRLWDNLRDQQPRTGLLCTHDPEEAIRLCDSVVILQGSSPATVGRRFEVPSSIRSLGLDDESEELWKFKREVVAGLEEAEP